MCDARALSDLYNWDDLGLIIPPDNDDPNSPLNPKAKLDRPHIIHNARTGQFVCWIKLMEKAGQTRTVLTAETRSQDPTRLCARAYARWA